MIIEHRVKRYRINEKDFPSKIPNDIKESFLEVIGSEGNIIALFYLYNSLYRKTFVDGLDFARYYDSLDIIMGLIEDEEWEFIVKNFGVSSREELLSSESEDLDFSKYPDSLYGYLSICFIAFARLKYPYCLSHDARKEYEYRINEWISNGQLDDFLDEFDIFDEYHSFEGSEYGPIDDDCLDILRFLINFYKVKDSIKNLQKLFMPRHIEKLVSLNNELLKSLSGDLFSRETIEPFIDVSSRLKRNEILGYLLGYKDSHFCK